MAPMASRVGNGPPVFTPPPGVSNDNRSDQRREQMLREMVDQQLVNSRNEGEHILESVVRSLRGPGGEGQGGLRVAPLEQPDARPGVGRGRPDEPPGQARRGADSGRAATADIPKLVADFQRQNGLPVTGRLDATTVNTMRERGVIQPMPPPSAGQALAPPQGQRPEPVPARVPARPDESAGARQLHAGNEQQVRSRVEGSAPRPVPAGLREGARPEAERVADPARLLASLVNAGFVARKGSLEEGLKSFQATFGLPISGTLDQQTQEALKSHGHLEADAPPQATTDKPVEPKQQVRRALNETVTSKTAADRDVARDPVRPQAATNKPTTSAEVAARAPSTTSSSAADKARLDTVMAQQLASERGVKEATGDPAAVKGHGEVAGKGSGQQGAGGAFGGGAIAGQGPGALTQKDGPAGDESAVGNTKAGDEDFLDELRGNANLRSPHEEDIGELGEGHWRVPPLSEQVTKALEEIVRDDDGAGPVTYSWDVTFFRPGIYAAGQPAEEMWRLAVQRATIFDPVWERAAKAIALRMLYAEPDMSPPTADDFVLALRRARVR
jgi:hypothetical protein